MALRSARTRFLEQVLNDPDELSSIGIGGIAEIEQGRHINVLSPTLHLPHVGLGPVKCLGYLTLGESRLLSGFPKQFSNDLVLTACCRSDCSAH